MGEKKKKDQVGVILEEVRGQYKAIQEGIDGLKDVPDRLGRLEADMQVVKSDVSVVKKAVTDTNKDFKRKGRLLKRHDKDIRKLKTRTV